MELKYVIDIIALAISIIALVISAWSGLTTGDIQNSSLTIQKSSHDMQQSIYNSSLPFQKPIIDVDITEFNANITTGINTSLGYHETNDCLNCRFDVTFIFKNYGNGIAKDISYSVVMCDINGRNWTDIIGSYSSVNEIYPNTISTIKVTGFYENCNYVPGVVYIDVIENEIAFVVKNKYYDDIADKMENQSYWFKYVISEDEIYDLTVEERNNLERNYEIFHEGQKFTTLFFNEMD